MARLAGFEPATPRLGIWCSILLSYGTNKPSLSSLHLIIADERVAPSLVINL